MVRRLILLAAASTALGVATLAGPVLAQESPPTPTTQPTPSTTEAPTTTTVPEATTTTEQVSPTTIERETTTTEAAVVTTAPPSSPTVSGVVVPRPLPRTGNDFGLQVILGAGLTAAGLAFAVTARLRRQRVNQAGT